MNDPHKDPNHIFTSHLAISHAFISNEGSQVTLLGFYGNLLDGEVENIMIETDFATFNDLLTEMGDEAEEAILQVSKLLANPSEETGTVDLCDSGGLHFFDLIFSLLVIYEEDEDGGTVESEEPSYYLNTYIKRENILPHFDEYEVPEAGPERLTYLGNLFAMQYQVYLSSRRKHGEEKALLFANLNDPIHFAFAKAQYEARKAESEEGSTEKGSEG